MTEYFQFHETFVAMNCRKFDIANVACTFHSSAASKLTEKLRL